MCVIGAMTGQDDIINHMPILRYNIMMCPDSMKRVPGPLLTEQGGGTWGLSLNFTVLSEILHVLSVRAFNLIINFVPNRKT